MNRKFAIRQDKPYNLNTRHSYASGGLLGWLNTTGNSLTGDKGTTANGVTIAPKTGALGLTKGGMALANAGASIGSGLVTGLLNSSGNTSGVGDAMSKVGSLASAIPGVGGLIGSAVSTVGGLVNTAFGSNINKQFVQQTNDSIDKQKSTVSNATSADQLLNDESNMTDLSHVSRSQVGSQGLFSNAASSKTNQLNNKIDQANMTMNRNLTNTANNINTNTVEDLSANYHANGGYLYNNTVNRYYAPKLEYADGGSLDYNPSDLIRSKISKWEGSSMKSNTPITTKAKEVASVTPNFNMLSQNQKDALFSYYYNVKPSTYKSNIVPLMSKLDPNADNSSILDTVASSINTGINRPNMGGLTKRRLYEQGLFRGSNTTPVDNIQQVSSQPFNIQPILNNIPNQQVNTPNNEIVDSNPLEVPNTFVNSNPILSGIPNTSANGGQLNIMANGGSINIDPANKGKLTATSKRTGKSFSELAHSSNPLTRKRAQFALNARHFNHSHADGGNLSRKDDYGSSENPYPFVVGSDFAGSNRSYPIPTKANAVDALRLAGLHNRPDVRAKVFAKYPDLDHSKADGGNLGNTDGGIFSNGVTTFDAGGTHEQNPLGGIPQGNASDGKPNLVEQGEVKYNNYIYSNRHAPDSQLLDIVGLNNSLQGKSFAKGAEYLSKESSERPFDPISNNGLKANMQKLQAVQELQRMAKAQANPEVHSHADGSSLDIPYANNSTNDYSQWTNWNGANKATNNLASNPINQFVPDMLKTLPSNNYQTLPEATVTASYPKTYNSPTPSKLAALRYAPAIGMGMMALSDTLGTTNKPDYNSANMIGNQVNHISNVNVPSVGNYLGYTPLDTQFYQNQLGNQASSTRSALVNNSGGNRANAQAGILAANYNYGNSVGGLARQAQEENLNQKMQVANFNRGTNEFNSDAAMKAASMNQSNQDMALRGRMYQAQLREQANTMSSQAKANNLSGTLTNLGNIGTDTYWKNAVNSNPAFSYLMGSNGEVAYKRLSELSQQEKDALAKKTSNNLNK